MEWLTLTAQIPTKKGPRGSRYPTLRFQVIIIWKTINKDYLDPKGYIVGTWEVRLKLRSKEVF